MDLLFALARYIDFIVGSCPLSETNQYQLRMVKDDIVRLTQDCAKRLYQKGSSKNTWNKGKVLQGSIGGLRARQAYIDEHSVIHI